MAPDDIAYASIGELETLLRDGQLSSVDLVRACLERVARYDGAGPTLHAVISLNAAAQETAARLDRERAEGQVRGPLHGIPVLLKDNIDTAGTPGTTAGSIALRHWQPPVDAPVACALRAAGAVLLGKANMSEWANFRSDRSSSGWSALGGQARNPHVLDRSPCGSSSGSAIAVAAGYVPASVGTETSGSILCPAAGCGVVGIKPTVGLTSRQGVIPISHSQDTVGPFARCVRDAALLLDAIVDGTVVTVSDAQKQPSSYCAAADSVAVAGLRVGVHRDLWFGYSPHADAAAASAIEALRDAGVEIVEGVEIPSAPELSKDRSMVEVLLYEFKADLNAYLARLGEELPVHSLAELIRFNAEQASLEMPYFKQELLEQAEAKGPLTEDAYHQALATCRRLSRTEGIDAAVERYRLDALIAPTTGPMWPIDLVNGDAHSGSVAGLPAMAGYPVITVPAGMVRGLPLGVAVVGVAWSERVLLRLAAAIERALGPAPHPRFLPIVLEV